MNAKRLATVQEHLKDYVRSRYTLIRVEPVLGLFNFRCHENVVEYNRRFPTFEVHEVICIDGGTPILHYINYDPEKKVYLETTSGWKANYMEYYHIRSIHKDDYPYILTEFERGLRSWTRQFTTWFDRHVLRIDRIL